MTTEPSGYELIDAGAGRKLERFGRYVLDRPCSQAVWRPALPASRWAAADAHFSRENGSRWQFRTSAVKEGWTCPIDGLSFRLRPTDFGHVGLFPEHSRCWSLIGAAAEDARQKGRRLNVLNLFAYTGGATLAAAQAGCTVCHLDASPKSVAWARENAAASHLEEAPIRWIVDDVRKFLQREMRRDRKYDGIILDPPSFGRGSNQELFTIDSGMMEVLDLVRQSLSETPAFVLLTCHTPGYTPLVLSHLVSQNLPEGHCATGEMTLPAAVAVLPVPSGAYAWWTP